LIVAVVVLVLVDVMVVVVCDELAEKIKCYPKSFEPTHNKSHDHMIFYVAD